MSDKESRPATTTTTTSKEIAQQIFVVMCFLIVAAILNIDLIKKANHDLDLLENKPGSMNKLS